MPIRTEACADVFFCVCDIFLSYLGGPVSILGVVANGLGIATFSRDKVTLTSTRLLLKAFCLANVAFLAVSFVFISVPAPFRFPSPVLHFFDSPAIYATLFYFANTFELLRNWLLVGVSVERLVFFIWPVHFRTTWTQKRVARTIAGVAVACLIIRIPAMMRALGEVTHVCPYEGEYTVRMIHAATDRVWLTVLPVPLMIGLSAAHAWRAPSYLRKREKFNLPLPQKKAPPNIFRVMRTVIATSVVLAVPSVCATSLKLTLTVEDHGSTNASFVAYGLGCIANFFSMTISLTNFVVYLWQSRRYRRIIARLLRLDGIRCCLRTLEVQQEQVEPSEI